MKRRNFLVGVGGTAVGASALVGSGAFSRVESDRHVNIQVASDEYAYLGLVPMDTPNANNYVDTDEKGHLYVDIADQPDGDGVNSNSTTWFEGMFEICNQGKDTATVSIDVAGLTFHPSAPEGINTEGGVIADVRDEDGNSIIFDSDDPEWRDPEDYNIELETGECEEMKIVTQTYGIDATKGEPLVEGYATVIADAPGAGQVENNE